MKVLAVCVTAVGLLGAASVGHAAVSSEALYTTSLATAPAGDFDGEVTLVSDGCGGGWYRGPGGACHPFGRGPGPGWYRPYWASPGAYCGIHRARVPGPWGWHWRWVPNC